MAGFGTPEEAWTVRHRLPGGGFVALGRGGRAWIEASAKRADPEGANVVALPVREAVESIREACREAEAFCEPREAFETAKIVRLDPVRDFDEVTHVGELLDGLAAVPRDVRHKTRRWADAEKNRAESLRVGPKAWGSTLYDKHAETMGRAPEGRLRYEGRFHSEQLTSQWAKENGTVMRQIADLSSEKVGRLTVASFQRVGFDREVEGRASVSRRVFGENGLSSKEKAGLWAFLTAPGFPESLSKPTRLKYRKLAGELGVIVAQAVDEAAPVFVRLDLESGREVCRAAA